MKVQLTENIRDVLLNRWNDSGEYFEEEGSLLYTSEIIEKITNTLIIDIDIEVVKELIQEIENIDDCYSDLKNDIKFFYIENDFVEKFQKHNLPAIFCSGKIKHKNYDWKKGETYYVRKQFSEM